MLVLSGPWILPLSLPGAQLPLPAASVVLSPSVWAPTVCMALCGCWGRSDLRTIYPCEPRLPDTYLLAKAPSTRTGRIPWLWSHLGLSPEPHSGLQVESRDRRQWLRLSVAETPPAFAGDTSSQASDPSRHLLQRPGLSPSSLGRESLHAPALPRHSTLGGRWCPAAYFQGALDSSWFGRRETAVSFRPECPHGPRGWGHLQP